MDDLPTAPVSGQDTAASPVLSLVYDRSINYAFQQNAIPVIRELQLKNDDVPRKDLLVRIFTEPAFALPVEMRLQGLDRQGEFRSVSVDLKLSHEFLASLGEKVEGWLKVEVTHDGNSVCAATEPISVLARNEWCGLQSLPEILAAFVLPNDPAVVTILGRAAEILREHTGRGAFNGYQDKNRRRVWEQVAALYKSVAEAGIRYIVAPASFETTGQKVRFPSDILGQKFGNCLDLALLFAACCEQVGLHPLVLMHQGHAYAGCWLEERTFPESTDEDLQHIRKLVDGAAITVFEATLVTGENAGTLENAEHLAAAHLQTDLPFRLALDVRRARIARIRPLPVPGQPQAGEQPDGRKEVPVADGIGNREFSEPLQPEAGTREKAATRIDQWKSRLLDLSLRNRLINFRETTGTVQILSAAPDKVEDELAAERELALQPRPRVMSEDDPRNAAAYTRQQKADALLDHLREELGHRRLHSALDESDHNRRLTELYRAARTSLEENGTNTLFAAVGMLEWRETEASDRVFRAPILLVPVELRRKSVLEGFSLRRIDEETRLNVTLMELLRQNFKKEIPGLDPLPEDHSGVDVPLVFRLFREAVRDLAGWEVREEIWLGLFSFTKFLLWKDLADRLEALTQNRVVRHLVHEAGSQYPNPPEDQDIRPNQIDDRFHPREIFCPRSADSSQLAAVLTAAAGHDYVLEGPPGTGKSQTITNIIAHCLSQGKRVLFVAEKRAALDVVYRRLREDGLEPFCLELHSNKTGKADVVAQFDRALKFAEEAPGPDWSLRTAELERLRTALNDYSRALHRRTPCGLSPFHCLDYLVPRQKEAVVRLDGWPALAETPVETLDRARQVCRQLQERSRPLLPLADHPLTLVARTEWSPLWAERALDRIRELDRATHEAAASSRELCDWFRFPRKAWSRLQLGHFDALAETLLAPLPVGPAFATTPWPQLAGEIESWTALARERMALRQKLAQRHGTAPGQTLPCESWSDETATKVRERGQNLEAETVRAAEAARELLAWMNAPAQAVARTTLLNLVELCGTLLSPCAVAPDFALTPWSRRVAEFDHWNSLVTERRELRSRLADYDEKKLLALDLAEISRRWQAGETAWFLPRFLHTAYVRGQLKTCRHDQKAPEAVGVKDTLAAAIRLVAINASVAAVSEAAEKYLGEIWRHGEPEPEQLAKAREFGARLEDGIMACTGNDSESEAHLRALIAKLFEGGPASFAPQTPPGRRFSRFREALLAQIRLWEDFVAAAALNGRPAVETEDYLAVVRSTLQEFLAEVARLREINRQTGVAAPVAQAALGEIWGRGEPVVENLVAARAWGEVLHVRLLACADDDLPWLGQARPLLASLFAEGPTAYAPGTRTGNRLAGYRQALAGFLQAYEAGASELALRREAIDAAADCLGTVQALTEKLPGAWSKIREWCSWQKARHEAQALGLSPVVGKLEAPDGHTLDIPALFERSFRRALLFAVMESSPAMREFFGREHTEKIERFREIDAIVARLARDLIRARLAAGIPRDQLRHDIPKAEIGLLRREIAKKTRHIPVRQLIARIPALLPRLKPCVLMSPLSVAQYLEATHDAFDVVIFDEASQIPVWDAVGAIARGKQLIVVGDPRQLPPTNFFASGNEDEDDLTPDEHKDMESILDELMTNGLRHKRLQWHYRSRHESLITFSNRQYYENDLLTFPSPEMGSGGVRFRHLPEARYDKGKSRTNRREAEALVEDLVARLKTPAAIGRSYGVVTFSQAQQKLVEDLLDQKRREHPEIEVHFGEECPVTGEPLFVKNLESVQGDERDVIFFSICYGPDENGKVSMHFGPINRDGGERRLNVAITRAKYEVVVFSGLRADQIDLTKTRARGVRDLKYFLDYADRGPRALAAAVATDGEAEPESEFERLVADRIRAEGYQVHHQIGCSGYRIDLAVVDPVAPGRYLLGIECDGASYHRAATARDRDKLRQMILTDLGWQLHRIWSTDWWHDPDTEMQKVRAAIASCVAERAAAASE